MKELAEKCRDVRGFINNARGYLEINDPKKADKQLEIAEQLMNEICYATWKLELPGENPPGGSLLTNGPAV